MGSARMRKVLVTGANGFIGRHLVKYLRGLNFEVRGYSGRLGRRQSAADQIALARAVRWCDGVVHLAGQPSVFRAQQDPIADAQTNILGTLQLLEQLRRNPRRLVYPSTIAVYRGRASGRSKEDEAVAHTFYATGKMAIENYIRLYGEQYGVRGVCLRLGYVYASDVARGPFFDVCSSIARRHGSCKIFVNPRSSFDFVHINDVMTAMVIALKKNVPPGAVFNIGTGKATSAKQLLGLATTEARVASPKISAPLGLEQLRLIMDCRAARHLLGWRPKVTLVAGIKDYLLKYDCRKNKRGIH